jgi:hypothetical protein
VSSLRSLRRDLWAHHGELVMQGCARRAGVCNSEQVGARVEEKGYLARRGERTDAQHVALGEVLVVIDAHR